MSESTKVVHRFRFNPEISMGHVIQVVLILIPAIIFVTLLETKVQFHEEAIEKLAVKWEQHDETISLLSKNNAVLTALFESHKIAEQKALMPKTP